jgi:eukaryotic-like serine/threonine-protein kinase
MTDLARGSTSRITFNPSWEYKPIWSPDGTKILFSSNREQSGRVSPGNLYLTAANGGTREELFLRSDAWKLPDDWSKDGKFILFTSAQSDENLPVKLWVVPVSGDREPRGALSGNARGTMGQFSPDGKWISYNSGESGRGEVYVQRFPPSGEKWQISSEGGGQSRWRGDGKELFFLSERGELMAVDVSLVPAFKASPPHALFKPQFSQFSLGNVRHQYAVSRDGQRFLVIVSESNKTALTVLTNWTADLKH